MKEYPVIGQMLHNGLTTCEGCSMEIVARAMLDILGPRTVMLTPPSCSAILTGAGLETGWKVPSFMSNLEAVAAYASGISEAYAILGVEDVNVVGFAGDGGTVDIGLQALSGAVERGHRFIYVCYDNEAYMNTGIQRSGATPPGAWTTTTPSGKIGPKKDVVAMLAAQGIPYLATASAGFIEDFQRKVRKAKDIDGPAYIHVHAPCPTGWRFAPRQTVNMARLAVNSGLWPLFEITGHRFRLTYRPKQLLPVGEYFRSQGRFSSLDDSALDLVEKEARDSYERLLKRHEEENG